MIFPGGFTEPSKVMFAALTGKSAAFQARSIDCDRFDLATAALAHSSTQNSGTACSFLIRAIFAKRLACPKAFRSEQQ
jgi:acyl-CoA reductase-like NAD-dependent aldehyde dehydrogenase